MEKKKTFILLGDVLSAQLSELLIDNKRALGKSVRTKYYNSLIKPKSRKQWYRLWRFEKI